MNGHLVGGQPGYPAQAPIRRPAWHTDSPSCEILNISAKFGLSRSKRESMKFSLSTLFTAALCISLNVYADQDQTTQWTLNLYLENDLFSNTDEGYTNGLRAAWVSPDVSDYLEDETLPSWIRSVNRRLTFFHQNREGLKRNLIFSLGQTLYTPHDLNRVDVVEDDRPYAAWLFASMGYQTRGERQMDTLEFSLGMVGPAALGQPSQDFIHKIRGFETFKGWDNQLNNELGAIFLWEHNPSLYAAITSTPDLVTTPSVTAVSLWEMLPPMSTPAPSCVWAGRYPTTSAPQHCDPAVTIALQDLSGTRVRLTRNAGAYTDLSPWMLAW